MKKSFKSALAVILTVITVLFSVFSAFAAETSDTARFGNSLSSSVKTHSAFSKVIDADKSTIAIPGLETTVFSDGTTADNMIPQGVCVANDYILITAYDYAKEHNSVIYVIDKKTGELKSVIEMPDKNHSGGIAFDGTLVWVAKSTSKKVKGIALIQIYTAAMLGGNYVLKNYDAVIDTDCTASFITAYDDSLWVGTFTEKGNSTLTQYKISYSLTSVSAEKGIVYTVPSKAQGAAFFTENETTYLAVTASYGRTLSSKLYLFTVAEDGIKMVRKLSAPPMLEEIDYSDGVLYSVFESAATEYSTKSNKCLQPVDVITVLDSQKLASVAGISGIEKISVFFASLIMKINALIYK